ncbi:MAG: glycosyltransferase [Candidatus Hodarchaeota archaeon]
MFPSLSIYFISLFLIFWAYCGYLIVLHLFSLFGKTEDVNQEIRNYPDISMLVPCYNEENLVSEKIENIKNLQYPKEKLNVFFLDGCSTDKTVQRINEKIKDIGNIKVIKTNCKGKINQINYILPQLSSKIIINNDMDTILNRDILIRMVKLFESDENISVVGAHVIPQNCMELEAQYWSDQNYIRILESKVHSSSIVIAPCYGFKRDLIEKFPEDCIADDIYISFLSNSVGKKSKYEQNAIAYETRTPSNIEDLLNHKFRKGNAYIIELLRFLYLLPKMLPRWRLIYLTKFLQVVLIPWIIPFFILSSISLLLSGIEYLKIVAFSFIFLLISLLITRWFFSRGSMSNLNGGYKKRSLLTLFIITNFILLLNGLTYMFYNQTSCYHKIKS